VVRGKGTFGILPQFYGRIDSFNKTIPIQAKIGTNAWVVFYPKTVFSKKGIDGCKRIGAGFRFTHLNYLGQKREQVSE
jgi:hypothetical protein